mmetsp:Transcript_46857/g.98368  ORF Transcript_46857/g.98368 Transcript_46857/m.98368 type:complete len:453 (+) Transcript_46857:1-1359(+)
MTQPQSISASSCFCFFYCVVPRHHSAISSESLQSRTWWRRLIRGPNHRRTTSDQPSLNTGESPRKQCNMLVLQCHSEGACWNGLVPLLMGVSEPTKQQTKKANNQLGNCASDKIIHENGSHDRMKPNNERKHSVTHSHIRKRGSKSCSILMSHFQHHIQRVSIITDAHANANAEEEGSSPKSNTCHGDNKAAVEKDIIHTTTSSRDWLIQQHYSSRSPPKNEHANIPTILLLLPPNPLHCNFEYYSRNPSTAPNSTFALRLIYLENTLIRLTSLSAYISTLGGGFFLCRYLSTAISLARRQCQIALLRGDSDMAMKCRINEGYCYIHAGKCNKGKKVIRRVLNDVTELQARRGLEHENGLLHHTTEKELSELTVIRNMCLSALRFANLVKEAGSSLKEDVVEEQRVSSQIGTSDGQQGGETPASNNGLTKKIISTTHDDFQRIRIVQDRKWR